MFFFVVDPFKITQVHEIKPNYDNQLGFLKPPNDNQLGFLFFVNRVFLLHP